MTNLPDSRASLWWQRPTMRTQHLTIAFGLGWARLEFTNPLWWWYSCLSQKNENRNIPSLWASSSFEGNREKSHASGTRKETRKFVRTFPCHSKWRGCSQAMTLLGTRPHLAFDEPCSLCHELAICTKRHVTSFLWKWKLHDFTFEKRLVGHILNKIIVIWLFKPAPFS